MTLPVLKRLVVVLGVFSTVLLVGNVLMFWNYGNLKVQAAFADEQTRIFDAMQMQSHQSTKPRDIAESLEYVAHYYPCLLYTSPSPRDRQKSRMPSSA